METSNAQTFSNFELILLEQALLNKNGQLRKPETKVEKVIYQVSEACQSNFFKWWKWPSSDEVPVKIMKKPWKPPHHDFMIWPPFYKFSQHEFIMFLH